MQQLARLNKKVLSVSSLNDIEEEKRYWLATGAKESLDAIEINRRMVYGKDRVSSRLQRFLETSELLSLDDLKANKKAFERHKDLEDLEHLP